jgi:hypothetical protein
MSCLIFAQIACLVMIALASMQIERSAQLGGLLVLCHVVWFCACSSPVLAARVAMQV